MTKLNSLSEKYGEWIRANTAVTRMNGYFVITTPFLDTHNDMIRLYAEETPDGTVRLSDDGACVNELDMLGIDHSPESWRSLYMRQTASGLGVRFEGTSIVTESSPDMLPARLHLFVTAISQIQALASAVPPVGVQQKMFVSETEHFLATNSVGFRRDVKLPGKSGFDSTFDFAFTRNNGLAQVSARIDAGIMRSTLFNIDDVRKNGVKRDMYLITKTKPSDKICYAIENDDVTLLPWDDRTIWVKALVA